MNEQQVPLVALQHHDAQQQTPAAPSHLEHASTTSASADASSDRATSVEDPPKTKLAEEASAGTMQAPAPPAAQLTPAQVQCHDGQASGMQSPPSAPSHLEHARTTSASADASAAQPSDRATSVEDPPKTQLADHAENERQEHLAASALGNGMQACPPAPPAAPSHLEHVSTTSASEDASAAQPSDKAISVEDPPKTQLANHAENERQEHLAASALGNGMQACPPAPPAAPSHLEHASTTSASEDASAAQPSDKATSVEDPPKTQLAEEASAGTMQAPPAPPAAQLTPAQVQRHDGQASGMQSPPSAPSHVEHASTTSASEDASAAQPSDKATSVEDPPKTQLADHAENERQEHLAASALGNGMQACPPAPPAAPSHLEHASTTSASEDASAAQPSDKATSVEDPPKTQLAEEASAGTMQAPPAPPAAQLTPAQVQRHDGQASGMQSPPSAPSHLEHVSTTSPSEDASAAQPSDKATSVEDPPKTQLAEEASAGTMQAPPAPPAAQLTPAQVQRHDGQASGMQSPPSAPSHLEHVSTTSASEDASAAQPSDKATSVEDPPKTQLADHAENERQEHLAASALGNGMQACPPAPPAAPSHLEHASTTSASANTSAVQPPKQGRTLAEPGVKIERADESTAPLPPAICNRAQTSKPSSQPAALCKQPFQAPPRAAKHQAQAPLQFWVTPKPAKVKPEVKEESPDTVASSNSSLIEVSAAAVGKAKRLRQMRKDFSNTGPSLEGTEGKRALDEIKKSKKSHILVSNPMKRKHDEVDAPEISTEQGRKVATPMNKNLASPAHTPRSGGSEMVSCLMLREETWRSLVRGDTSPIYLFRSYALNQFPSTFHIIISDNAGTQCEHVGLITLDKCEQVKRFYPWKSFMLNVLESKTWANRVREREKVFAWRVATVTPLDNPIRIRFASGKFRNRHFTCKKKNLYQVMDLPAPAPSLFETAQFFMKLLPPRYQERLARVAGVMNKRILRVGTACSGSDICMVAIRALLQAMNKEFNVSKQDHTECSKCTLFPTRTMIGETRATRSMQYIYRVVNGVYIYIVVWSCVYCHSLTILRLRLACATSFQLKRTRKRLTTYLQLIRR